MSALPVSTDAAASAATGAAQDHIGKTVAQDQDGAGTGPNSPFNDATAMESSRSFTYVDNSGSFPGLGHCVDGILRAHLQARDANIRVAELPTFMLEYCEEDIATAMGVELPAPVGSAEAWNLVTEAASDNMNEVTGTASDVVAALEGRRSHPSQAVVVVTRRHSVVRVPEHGDSPKMKMVRKMCSRLSALYTPKCCAAHKPCCSNEWRARFASRSDALRYCYLVRDTIQGRTAQAMRKLDSEVDALEKRAQSPEAKKTHFNPVNPDCLPGGAKEFSIECGRLGDGSKLMTDGGRSLPSFRKQGERLEVIEEAKSRLLARARIRRSLDRKLRDILEMRNQKVTPEIVTFELQFSTHGALDAADHADTVATNEAASLLEENGIGALPGTVKRLKRAVAKSLFHMQDDLVEIDQVSRACPKSKPCSPWGTSSHGKNLVDHIVHVRLLFTGKNQHASRVARVLEKGIYKTTLQAAFSTELPSKEHGGQYPSIAFTSVTDVKTVVGDKQEAPAWYRAQLNNKVSAAREERDSAAKCEALAKQLVSLTRRKSDDAVEIAILRESGRADLAQSLVDHVER